MKDFPLELEIFSFIGNTWTFQDFQSEIIPLFKKINILPCFCFCFKDSSKGWSMAWTWNWCLSDSWVFLEYHYYLTTNIKQPKNASLPGEKKTSVWLRHQIILMIFQFFSLTSLLNHVQYDTYVSLPTFFVHRMQ